MSTKPNETGWTTADPKVDGVYWWRVDESDNDPDIHFVQGESFYRVGFASSEFTAKFGGEWFGPISPSDFEQLIRLRKAANDADEALQLIQGFDFQLDSSAHGQEIRRRAIEAIAALREAFTVSSRDYTVSGIPRGYERTLRQGESSQSQRASNAEPLMARCINTILIIHDLNT